MPLCPAPHAVFIMAILSKELNYPQTLAFSAEEEVLEPKFLRYQGPIWLLIDICAHLVVPHIECRLNALSTSTMVKKARDG